MVSGRVAELGYSAILVIVELAIVLVSAELVHGCYGRDRAFDVHAGPEVISSDERRGVGRAYGERGVVGHDHMRVAGVPLVGGRKDHPVRGVH